MSIHSKNKNMVKRILTLTAISAMLWSACNAPSSDMPTPTPAPKTTAAQAVAQKLFEHFNAHKWTALAELYANPAEFLDPSLGIEPVKQTHEQIAAKYAELEKMSADVRDDIKAMYPVGDNTVVVEFESSGTVPDGWKWKMPICSVLTIEGGKIVRDNTYFDSSPGGE
jgi:ketosteroid isomerase-like protein